MKASDVQAYLQSLSGNWRYPADTVDTFKSGDPEVEVKGIAIGWMSYTWALKKALELGCNVFITHEPTYYNHYDNDADIFRFPIAQKKRDFIEKSGLTIIRCHDLWDQIPHIGIPDSWGRLLQLGQATAQTEHLRVYDGGGVTALEIAQRVARYTSQYGQPGVQLIGDEKKIVHRVSIGTGAITPYFTFIADFNVDLAICTDDGVHYWRDGGFAIDAGIPMIVVHHHVSEEIGVQSMAEHLQEALPNIPVHYIAQQCMYRLIQS